MSLVCEWCTRQFEQTDSRRGPVPVYCTPSCRQRAYEQRQAEKRLHDAADGEREAVVAYLDWLGLEETARSVERGAHRLTPHAEAAHKAPTSPTKASTPPRP